MKKGVVLGALLGSVLSIFATASANAVVLSAGYSYDGAASLTPVAINGTSLTLGTFTISSLNLSGSDSPQGLFAGTFNVLQSDSATHTLDIFFTVSGLTVPPSGIASFLSAFDAILPTPAVANQLVTEKTFLDPANGTGKAGAVDLIGSLSTSASGSNALNVLGSIGGLTPGQSFSLTEEFFIQSGKTIGQGFQISAQVGAVPEPGTWALMGIGFACLGFMAYRRRGSAESFRFG